MNIFNKDMKYYAVLRGKQGPKIYQTWKECQQNVTGFSNACFKSFTSMEEALRFIGGGSAAGPIGPQSPIDHSDCLIVYTDGCGLHPGTKTALAGSGVYIPDWNQRLSYRPDGIQTNHRS